MRFIKFEIENFKGIKKAELNLSQNGQGKIFTLVGLNECGKTTILEAINSFSPDQSAEKLFKNDVFRKISYRDLVPKHLKDNFTGNVRIRAFLELSDKDISAISNYALRAYKMNIDLTALGNSFEVEKAFRFENSDFKSEKNLWTIKLYGKTVRAKNYKELTSDSEVWQGIVQFIKKRIPSITYFPTFLFEFPTRVYLSRTPDQYEPQNQYYRQIIQDILDSLDRDLTIEEHIVERVEKIDKGEKWDFFKFFESDRKEQVDAVMNRLGNEITSTVFNRWNEIFNSKFTKRVKIEWGVDNSSISPPIYLSFSIQDGSSTYAIAERSLGFRWFFCFLLFTQFRNSRSGSGTLFLMDEPASNLHATAQQQLLSSFESVTDGNNRLIYSTHSHYMINPSWLEGSFIVQNGAIEYGKELGSGSFEFHETDIRVTPYRRFVGENPNKSTYYQPILDALDYRPSILEHQSRTIMIEGKNDFYAFSYFKDVIFSLKSDLKFLPSTGASGLGPLISLYLGWSFEFKILLDDDNEGRAAQKRYMENFYLDNDRILTLSQLDKRFRNKRLEGLFTEEAKKRIKENLGVKKLSKKMIGNFLQDKLARKEKFEFDQQTVENFKKVLNILNN